jgi:phosphoribosylanthranilate isomerase
VVVRLAKHCRRSPVNIEVGVRVKICGVTRGEDAEASIALGAEMIGLNFYPPSPRCLSINSAKEISRAIGKRAVVIGVFVNATRDYIEERRRELDLDMIQFHGDEDESELKGWPVEVIRAFRLRADLPNTVLPETCADHSLLDTFHPGLYGGSGQARPLKGLERFDLSRVFISGGLTPENVGAAAALNPYAVDVASGVESAPGVKDFAKLRSFIANAKSSR